MCVKRVASLVLVGALAGCGRLSWPDPPPVDAEKYRSEYTEWREGQQETAVASMKIIGIWPLEEGDTPFGADSRYTTCPLPPAENRLAVAIEAGEKRFPLDQALQ